jgi:MerR family transcriptional regulator, light-induced transcriptional regulator
MRPSAVLPASTEQLRALIGEAKSLGGETVGRTTSDSESSTTYAVMWQQWLEHVANFEGRAFDRQLRVAWGQLGGMRFLTELLGPFLCELGTRWERGEIGVRHEHFASERLREFLAGQWRAPSDAATGPTCVCATLSGEEHVLGLHMAAAVLSMCNARIVFLGANVPPSEIADAVTQYGAQAVVLSAAASHRPTAHDADAAALRAALSESVPIVVGGSGFSSPPVEVQKLEGFEALEAWARQLGTRGERLLSK